MKVLCETQGTPEWHAARSGVLTASGVRVALSGKNTKGRRLYLQKIVDDLDGIPDFDTEEPAPWFTDGLYYESWARGWYAWHQNQDVRETGFVVHDDYSFIGASPDGLVDPDGLLEIKYRKTLRAFKQHSALGYNGSVKPQIQTQLFVTGRKWCDYVNYWRSVDHELEQGFCERIYRDDAYINNVLLPAFISLWKDVERLLSERRSRYL